MLWLACAAPSPQDSAALLAPSILQVDLSCNRDSERWDIGVLSSGWVSGATWWVAPPSLPLEAHPLRSDSAAADGSAEALSLSLDQQADPRLQVDGSSTNALCSEDQTAMRLETFDPQSGETAACWVWGGPLAWEAFEMTEDCEIRDLSW